MMAKEKTINALDKNGNKQVCNYCKIEWDANESLLSIESHIQEHVKRGDKILVEKNPDEMSFDEKKEFFTRVYNDKKIKNKLADKAVMKTLSEICKEQSQVREVYAVEINAKIKWQPMTGEDYLQIANCKNEFETKQQFVYHHLKRVNPECTEEYMKEMPAHVLESIFIAIQEDLDFLAMKPLQNALRKTTS